MTYTTLGKTNLQISRLGFGGIPIQKTDVATVRKLIESMVEKGINYIDTARGYTVSESFLGEALEGYRDKFILATKSMARTKEAMASDITLLKFLYLLCRRIGYQKKKIINFCFLLSIFQTFQPPYEALHSYLVNYLRQTRRFLFSSSLLYQINTITSIPNIFMVFKVTLYFSKVLWYSIFVVINNVRYIFWRTLQ